MVSYILVQEDEHDSEPVEIPSEEDDTLLLSTVTAQFPGASGLKFKTPSGTTRGLRLANGAFHPPSTGWGDLNYICVFPKENKRKSDDQLENSYAKTKRIETKLRCSDLIILGLPWKSTEDELRKYFESFGEIIMLQIKKDNEGQSRGYGFIRFADYESQARVLAQRHMIDGRWCDVKIPNSKEGVLPQSPCKVFVGRCTEDITADDLKEYFSQFGTVTDVFIPKPYRAFAFVTFSDPQVAFNLFGEDHIVKGVSVNVSEASPKNDNKSTNGSERDASGGKKGRGNDDMPNLSSLGLNNSSISPAVLAAALNQAGLGELIYSMKNGPPSDYGSRYGSGSGFNYSGGFGGGPGFGGGRYPNEPGWKRRYNY